MGTLGGKVGFIAGLLAMPFAGDHAIDLICPTFSEGGGGNQTAILAGAFMLALGASLPFGLLVRLFVNRLART